VSRQACTLTEDASGMQRGRRIEWSERRDIIGQSL